MHRQGGFTLNELLTVLVIVTIITTAGLPALSEGISGLRANNAVRDWFQTFQLARNLAVEYQDGTITLCGSPDGQRCSSDWGHGWMLFGDRNGNHRYESGEPLYRRDTQADTHAHLQWRGSGNRPYLRFTRMGAAEDFGSLTYCANDGRTRHARQIILSMPGRPRIARDSNGDGIVEDSEGKPLHCESGS